MIDYLKGTLTQLSPTYAVIECNGVGYGVAISLTTYTKISSEVENVKLYIHEAIREDAYNLYGCATREERDLLRLLITVNGVGANSARLILSAFDVDQIVNAICFEDIKTLKGIKGIGPKTAQRIIVELKDKAEKLMKPSVGKPAAADPQTEGAKNALKKISDITPEQEDALMALEVLGISRSVAQEAVLKVCKASPELNDVGDIVKAALRIIK